VRPLKRAVTEQARILADALHRVLTLLIGNHEPGILGQDEHELHRLILLSRTISYHLDDTSTLTGSTSPQNFSGGRSSHPGLDELAPSNGR